MSKKHISTSLTYFLDHPLANCTYDLYVTADKDGSFGGFYKVSNNDNQNGIFYGKKTSELITLTIVRFLPVEESDFEYEYTFDLKELSISMGEFKEKGKSLEGKFIRKNNPSPTDWPCVLRVIL